MFRRRSFRGGASRGATGRPLRPMDWWRGTFNSNAAGSSVQCAWMMLPSLLQGLSDPTSMAARIAVATRTLDAATAGDTIAYGVIAWDYVDPITNAVPVPCPALIRLPLEQDLDWLWRYDIPLAAGTPAGIVDSNSNGPESYVSTRAKRRLGNQSSLLFVAQNVGIGVEFHAHWRVLVKE